MCTNKLYLYSIPCICIFVDGSTHAFDSRALDKRSVAGQPIDDVLKTVDGQRVVFIGKINKQQFKTTIIKYVIISTGLRVYCRFQFTQ